MFDYVSPPPPAWTDPRSLLSEREAEVLELAAQGLTNSELAARLEITVHTVKFHLASVYRKLGVANRTEAVAVLFRSRARAAALDREAVG